MNRQLFFKSALLKKVSFKTFGVRRRMKRVAASLLFATALVLATYGVTRHQAATHIQKRNEAAFTEYAKAETLLRNQEEIARGEEPTGWQFPDHVRKLHHRLVMVDGIYEFRDGMIVCGAGAAILCAIGLFMCKKKRNSEPTDRQVFSESAPSASSEKLSS